MNAELTTEQILEPLITEVADCLALDVPEVTPESTFFEDLGGESIDLLDIAFRMQRRLGIHTNMQEFRSALEFDKEGKISVDTITRLQVETPAIDWAAHLSGKEGGDFFTIRLIAEMMLQSHLRALAAGKVEASTDTAQLVGNSP